MMLNTAIEMLASTYQSLDLMARGCVVDAEEVYDALQEVESGSVEEVCLQYLAKYNPYTPPPKAK